MKHVFLINSFSLRNRTNQMIKRINEVASSLNFDYVIEVNDINNSTEDIIKKYKNKENIIYAVGGDGVVNRVLNSIVGTKNILGIIPCGNGNDFYKTIKETFTTKIQEVDVLEVNNKYFVNLACFGISDNIKSSKLAVNNKLVPSSIGYSISLLKGLTSYNPKKYKVILDNKTYGGYYTSICICNGRYFSGYKINPNGNIKDGLFDLIIANKLSRITLFKFLLSIKRGKTIKNKNIKYFKSNKVIIKSDQDILMNIDGEEVNGKVFKINSTSKKIKVYYDRKLINMILTSKTK